MRQTSWHFYLNSDQAWDAMLIACKNAKTAIDLEQFILRTDDIGNKFIDVLREKAKEGIRVRILCDAAGSFGLYNSKIPEQLRADGIRMAFFNTLIPGGKHNYTAWLFRDHQKLLIVDGAIAFTGGICLSEEMRHWRDTHVRIEGEVIEQMQYSFNKMWRRAFKNKERKKMETPPTSSGFTYVTNAPLPGRRFLYHNFIDAMRGARKYIYLTTPYFVPDHRFARVLKLAAARGVDVRLILPHASDHPIVDYGSQSFFNSILSAGVRIFRYKNLMIHAKTAIIDDEWATVGSFNLDNLSFLYNFEGNIVSHNKAFALELKRHFQEDLQKTDELTEEEWKKRSITQKICEWLTWPVRKIL